MKIVRLAFYGFFLVFNSLFILYNIVTGFDWSKVLFPCLICLFCVFALRAVMKEDQQSK